nr:hypothetical protein [Nanoarchaeum sp.]
MTWEIELMISTGYYPQRCIQPNSIVVYQAKKGNTLAVAKIARYAKDAQALQEERVRLAENQDLEWVPRLLSYRDYIEANTTGARILERFKEEGWEIRNPVILVKEFIPGTTLDKSPKSKLNRRQYNCVQTQMRTLHERGYAGLDISSCNILVQSPTHATLFDFGPSIRDKPFEARKQDDITSLELLLSL